MVTRRRISKMKSVLSKRQEGIVVVLDELYDPFNISAIFRTCDGLGISEIHLIMPPKGFKPSKSVCMKAHQWLEVKKSNNRHETFENLKKRGFKIYGTALEEKSKDFREIDLTQPFAIVLGNEHAGIGEEAKELCDELIHIPMYGFVQSFNVSVSAAIFLSYFTFEKERKGISKYFSQEKQDKILEYWLEREENKKKNKKNGKEEEKNFFEYSLS